MVLCAAPFVVQMMQREMEARERVSMRVDAAINGVERRTMETLEEGEFARSVHMAKLVAANVRALQREVFASAQGIPRSGCTAFVRACVCICMSVCLCLWVCGSLSLCVCTCGCVREMHMHGLCTASLLHSVGVRVHEAPVCLASKHSS